MQLIVNRIYHNINTLSKISIYFDSMTFYGSSHDLYYTHNLSLPCQTQTCLFNPDSQLISWTAEYGNIIIAVLIMTRTPCTR